MSVQRKVFSDSAFTAFRSIISIARGLIVIPLITNLLGAGSYGVWVTIIAIVGLLSSTGEMHLHGSLVRYTSKETNHHQTYSDVLFLTLIIGIMLGVLTAILGNIINLSMFLEGEVSNQTALAIVAAILIISSMIYNINVNFPRAKGNVKIFDLIKIVRQVIETIFLLTIFLVGGGILDGLLALVIISISLNVVLLFLVFLKFNIPKPHPPNFRRYIRYGVPMVPGTLSSNLLKHVDKYLLLFFLGPSAVGIYAVAKAICQPMMLLTKIFDPTLYPIITQEWDAQNFDEIINIYRGVFRFYLILGIPSMVGIVILAEPLLTLVSTAEIAQQGLALVPIFILGYFLRGFDNSIRYILTSAERTSIIGGAVGLTVVINFILNIILIPQLNILGAAFATLISYFILVLIIMYYSFSLIKVPIPLGSMVRSGISALIMGIFLMVIDMNTTMYWDLVIYPVFGIVIFFAVLIGLGEFTKSEIMKIINTM